MLAMPSNKKLTGKRRSMSIDVVNRDYEGPTARSSPLVPDISPAQKAMIHEQLSKTLHLTESITRDQLAPGDAKGTYENVTDLSTAETKSQKIGRKIRGLFMNDQKIPSRQQSLDNRPVYRKSEEDELYRIDGRSRNKWGI